jgi:hypothetical protein
MVFISGYSNDLYNRILSREKGWQSKTIEATTRDSSGRSHLRTEIVWMNRYFCKAKMDMKVPIRLFAKEIDENKLNPIRPRKREEKKRRSKKPKTLLRIASVVHRIPTQLKSGQRTPRR